MRSRPIFVRTAALFAFACAMGCASEKDALDKRVATLQEELVAVQNANDRLAERLMALEIQQARGGSGSGKKATRAEAEAEPEHEAEEDAVDRPPLKVVRLAPGSQTGGSAAAQQAPENMEDDANRPVIRDLGSGRSAGRAGARSGIVTKVKDRTDPTAGER